MPGIDRDQRTPEQLHAHASQLARRAIDRWGSKKGRDAYKELTTECGLEQYLDPAFGVFATYQDIMRAPHNQTTERSAHAFLDSFTNEVFASTAGSRKVVRINGPLRKSVSQLQEGQRQIERSPQLRRAVGDKFVGAIESYLPTVDSAIRNGRTEAIILIDRTSQNETEAEASRARTVAYNRWSTHVNDLLGINSLSYDPGTRDSFFHTLRSEPSVEGVTSIFDQRYGGLRLRDIEGASHHMLIGFTPEFRLVSSYVAEALEHGHIQMQNIVKRLFFGTSYFSEQESPTEESDVTYRPENSRLFANINTWQRSLMHAMIFPQDEATEQLIGRMLRAMSRDTASELMRAFSSCVFHPRYMEPQQGITMTITTDGGGLEAQPIYDFQRKYGDLSPYLENPELIKADYIRSHYVPRLRERFTQLGVAEKFEGPLQKLDQRCDNSRIFETNSQVLAEDLEAIGARQYLDRYLTRVSELTAVTEKVMPELQAGGVHFIPMNDAINTLEFSSDKVEYIIGLRRVRMIRFGDEQDWKLFVRVEVGEGENQFPITGVLDRSGNFTPHYIRLDDIAPGYHEVIRNVTVLTLKDLVTQREAEGSQANVRRRTARQEGTVAIPPDTQTSGSIYRHGGSLPRERRERVQSTDELIDSVHTVRRQTRRKVGIHRAHLPGAVAYRNAVMRYEEILHDSAMKDEQKVRALIAQMGAIEVARENADKVTQQKRDNIPAGMDLESFYDPYTGKIEYQRTWVIAYESPQRQPGETAANFYERAYYRASSLAFTQHYLPLVMGERQ